MERRDILKAAVTVGAVAMAPQLAEGRSRTVEHLIDEHRRRDAALERAGDVVNAAEEAMQRDRERNTPLTPFGVSYMTGKPIGGYLDVSVIPKEDCQAQIRRYHAQFLNMIKGEVVSVIGDDALEEAQERVMRSQKAAMDRLDACIEEYDRRSIVGEYERLNALWHEAADARDDALIAIVLAKPRDAHEARLRSSYLADMADDLRDFFDSDRFTRSVIGAYGRGGSAHG